MSGIYVHVPFCRQRCHYCDFYKSTNVDIKSQYLNALQIEIAQRAEYIGGETIDTIYLGGGTPSQLSITDLETILEALSQHFIIGKNPEITIETNPDDLTDEYLHGLRNTGFNRISIGVQSFFDADLKLMNRRHNAHQAITAIETAFRAGFNNIGIDLIFGMPNSNSLRWQQNLETAMQLPIEHLSAYHITYHENTQFQNLLEKGKIVELSEDESLSQFEMLLDITAQNGFEHYEISNFARNKNYSRHNRKYWLDEKYLGLGPSAHSYNRISRQWNVADVDRYIASMLTGEPLFEKEILTEKEKANDFILTRIRTKWGIHLDDFEKLFGKNAGHTLQKSAQRFIDSNHLKSENGTILLTRKGIMISDEILVALIIE